MGEGIDEEGAREGGEAAMAARAECGSKGEGRLRGRAQVGGGVDDD